MKNRRLILLRIAASRFRNKVHRKRKGRNCYISISLLRKLANMPCEFNTLYQLVLPKNLRYLLETEKSPFCLNNLKPISSNIISIPKTFSIIDNPKESYQTLQNLVCLFVQNKYKILVLDYQECESIDLLTQVVVDSILLDIRKFLQISDHIAKTESRYRNIVKLKAFSGININHKKIQNLINSVGSARLFMQRIFKCNDIIPFELRIFNRDKQSEDKSEVQKEIDSTAVIDYVNQCLGVLNKELTQISQNDLGRVVGETIINAEEHSSLGYRYMIGYFEDIRNVESHYGYLRLVIMNYGKTIYEVFKYPELSYPVNERNLQTLMSHSSKFPKDQLKKHNLTEENLWTLYSLQDGITCVPSISETVDRGSGTMKFIESFFNLKGNNYTDNESSMYILSGNTKIKFDGTYLSIRQEQNDGQFSSIITFNKSNSFTELPDNKYVVNTENYFPGTAIFANIKINENIIEKKNE